MSNIKVTVFTHTYNRASKIGKFYESLKKQSDNSFEWIIVDDGQDNTIDLVKEYKKEADFPIHYFRSEGERGISREFNLMLTKAKGFFVMKVGDDDVLTSDALEKVLGFESIITAVRTHYAGVSGLKAYSDGKYVRGYFQTKQVDCKFQVLEGRCLDNAV